jgi:carbon-monoxide dehydrogenase medium subunit
MAGWRHYYLPTTVDEAVMLLQKLEGQARLVAGGTDLLVDTHRHKAAAAALVDITRIPELQAIRQEDGHLVIGAAVTHARLASSPQVQGAASLLAQAAWQIGSPQVRNRGTLGGNLGTASPSGDLLPPLAALEAEVQIAGPSGLRWMRLADFLLGVKQTALGPSELVCAARFRPLKSNASSIFLKYGVRRGRSIAVASAAVILEIENSHIQSARVALGAVSPRVQRFPRIEGALVGQRADSPNWAAVQEIAARECSPISDLRASVDYRRHLAGALVARAVSLACDPHAAQRSLRQVRDGVRPFMLGRESAAGEAPPPHGLQPVEVVRCRLNGREATLPSAPGMTLLQALRQGAALTGTKEGCAEGECGACTVLLDGLAVLACLTPAAAAHGRDVRPVESAASGQSESRRLSAVQRALIDAGAVHCGFCTPGLVMSATALIESQAWSFADEPELHPLIREALSGNLCRCTGYSLIVDAIVEAVEQAIVHSQEAQP